MVGALLLISLGSLPAFLARYVFLKRPLSKKLAFGILVPIWLALQWLFREPDVESFHSLISAVSVISFFTLTSAKELFSSVSRSSETSEHS